MNGIVSIEFEKAKRFPTRWGRDTKLPPPKQEKDKVIIFKRIGDTIIVEKQEFRPFMWMAAPSLLKQKQGTQTEQLKGKGLNTLCSFSSFNNFLNEKTHATQYYKKNCFYFSDIKMQYLMHTRQRLFGDMEFKDLRRFFFDIESSGLGEDAEILIIGYKCGDELGSFVVGRDGDEKTIIEKFIAKLRGFNPDTIETYNGMKFDLPLLARRCRFHRIPMAISRIENMEPYFYENKIRLGDITTTPITQWHIPGRQTIDLFYMVKKYDAIVREFNTYKLEDVIEALKFTRPNRTFMDSATINEEFKKDPERVVKYCLDDVLDTETLSNFLMPLYFAECKMIPMNYDKASLAGNMTKFASMVCEDYYHTKTAIPFKQEQQDFQGATVSVEQTGVFHNVYHIDFASLYPSIMLKYDLFPKSDTLGIMRKLLEKFKTDRLKFKKLAKTEKDPFKKLQYEGYSGSMKGFINSMYGITSNPAYPFNDYEVAAGITAKARELLDFVTNEAKRLGCIIIERDTDGIYLTSNRPIEVLINLLQVKLPEGIVLDYTKYKSMLSSKSKNYLLLTKEDKLIIRGAALKSRALEKFGRDFISTTAKYLLTEKHKEIRENYIELYNKIITRNMTIDEIKQSQNLKISKYEYESKNRKDKVYERVLALGRPITVGNKVFHYNSKDGTRLAEEFNNDYDMTYMLRRLKDFTLRFRDILSVEKFNELFYEPGNYCKDDYRYVWLWSNDGTRHSKWMRRHEDTIPSYIEDHPNKSCYSSVQKYLTEDEIADEKYIMPLYFDIDNEGDLEKSAKDTKTLVEYLMSKGLKEKDINIYFSGNKGFHIMVSPTTLGLTPEKHNPYIKFVCKKIAEETKVIIDNSYAGKKLLKIPNSIHYKTKLYNIPVTFQELINIDNILKRATSPRILDFGVPEQNDEAIKWFVSYKSDFEHFRETLNKVEVKSIDFMPKCIEELLAHSIKVAGTRNKAVMLLGSFFKAFGTPLSETLDIIDEFVSKIPKELSTFGSRDDLVITHIYNSNNYKFSCGYAKGFKLKCSKDCKLKSLDKEVKK